MSIEGMGKPITTIDGANDRMARRTEAISWERQGTAIPCNLAIAHMDKVRRGYA